MPQASCEGSQEGENDRGYKFKQQPRANSKMAASGISGNEAARRVSLLGEKWSPWKRTKVHGTGRLKPGYCP